MLHSPRLKFLQEEEEETIETPIELLNSSPNKKTKDEKKICVEKSTSQSQWRARRHETPQNKTQKLECCIFYLRGNKCKKGDDCLFTHPAGTIGEIAAVCHRWQTTCWKFSKGHCPFFHPQDPSFDLSTIPTQKKHKTQAKPTLNFQQKDQNKKFNLDSYGNSLPDVWSEFKIDEIDKESFFPSPSIPFSPLEEVFSRGCALKSASNPTSNHDDVLVEDEFGSLNEKKMKKKRKNSPTNTKQKLHKNEYQKNDIYTSSSQGNNRGLSSTKLFKHKKDFPKRKKDLVCDSESFSSPNDNNENTNYKKQRRYKKAADAFFCSALIKEAKKNIERRLCSKMEKCSNEDCVLPHSEDGCFSEMQPKFETFHLPPWSYFQRQHCPTSTCSKKQDMILVSCSQNLYWGHEKVSLGFKCKSCHNIQETCYFQDTKNPINKITNGNTKSSPKDSPKVKTQKEEKMNVESESESKKDLENEKGKTPESNSNKTWEKEESQAKDSCDNGGYNFLLNAIDSGLSPRSGI